MVEMECVGRIPIYMEYHLLQRTVNLTVTLMLQSSFVISYLSNPVSS